MLYSSLSLSLHLKKVRTKTLCCIVLHCIVLCIILCMTDCLALSCFSFSLVFSSLLLSYADGGGGAENAASAAIEIGFGAGGE